MSETGEHGGRLEGLSCLVDGEQDSGVLARQDFVNVVSGDDTLRAAWYRYHLIGDALRGALSARVAGAPGAAHAGTTSVLRPAFGAQEPRRGVLRRRATVFALAASLFIVVLLASHHVFFDRQTLPAPSSGAAVAEAAVAVPVLNGSLRELDPIVVSFTGGHDAASGLAPAGARPERNEKNRDKISAYLAPAGARPEQQVPIISVERVDYYMLHYRRYAPGSGVPALPPYGRVIVQ